MIRLLIADSQKMVRQGLACLLGRVDGFAVAAEADDEHDVVRALKVYRIDVALFAQSLPERGGIALVRDAKVQQPGLRTLVLSPTIGDPHLLPALHAGADGYITKQDSSEELVAAVRRLAEGGRYICRSVAERQTFEFVGADTTQPGHLRLSRREFAVFELLVAGKRGAEIAVELSLSEKTVSTHKASVLRKLNLAGVAELVRYAIRHDLSPR